MSDINFAEKVEYNETIHRIQNFMSVFFFTITFIQLRAS